MRIEDNVERLKMNSFKWTCPKCGEEIGPEMTKEKVVENAKDHLREDHPE
ncbi:MAG: hypothetical protein ACLFUR_05200 [Candidatus Hadarchaeia archaeon]